MHIAITSVNVIALKICHRRLVEILLLFFFPSFIGRNYHYSNYYYYFLLVPCIFCHVSKSISSSLIPRQSVVRIPVPSLTSSSRWTSPSSIWCGRWQVTSRLYISWSLSIFTYRVFFSRTRRKFIILTFISACPPPCLIFFPFLVLSIPVNVVVCEKWQVKEEWKWQKMTLSLTKLLDM